MNMNNNKNGKIEIIKPTIWPFEQQTISKLILKYYIPLISIQLIFSKLVLTIKG